MKIKFADLWRCDGTIGRAPYFILGVSLCLLKFGLDCGVSYLIFGKPWAALNYEIMRLPALMPSDATPAQLLTLVAIALPFLWAGTALSIRRLRSAALPAWLVVLFVIPWVKFPFFALLCLRGEKTKSQTTTPHWDNFASNALASAVAGLLVSGIGTIVIVYIGVELTGIYGWGLFIGMPFAMGFTSVLIFGCRAPRSLSSSLGVAAISQVAAAALLLAVGWEGVICLIMAAPLALGMALIGGAIAYQVNKFRGSAAASPKFFGCAILFAPLAMGLERFEGAKAPLLQVKSFVIINASPQTVWKNVIAFPDLPTPREWPFRMGVAYPVRARIERHGPGAMRYCCFSTGSFVEPIETWDEPHLLKFSVTDNPPAMREFTFYRDIEPPHVNGYLVSKAGQFQLTPLPDGRTELEGTTWYRHNLWPAAYWQLWSDFIIHRIHLQVLDHIKKLSEQNLPVK